MGSEHGLAARTWSSAAAPGPAVSWTYYLRAVIVALMGINNISAKELLIDAEYCQKEGFKAKCGQNQVIVMNTAKYGRMALGRCVKVDFGYLGCSSDVLLRMDSLCSGRHICDIPNLNGALDAKNPCLELTRYLRATYTCQEVVSASRGQCQMVPSLKAPLPSGYLSNTVTAETGCGGQYHPWVIEALPAQRINLTLLDFGARPDSLRDTVICREYAVLRETGRDSQPTTVCGGNDRVKHILLSEGHRVELQFNDPPRLGDTYFLIKYEVLGCAEPRPPPNTWLKRDGYHVIIGCTASDKSWRLECRHNKWHGHMESCDGAGVGVRPDSSVQHIIGSLPNGVAVLLIVAIALFISIAILVAGLMCIRRRKPSNRPAQAVPLRDAFLTDGGKQSDYHAYDIRAYDVTVQSDTNPYLPRQRPLGSYVSSLDRSNDYGRSYTHQQHTLAPDAPPPYPNYSTNASSPRPPSDFVEHIYESPKFVRKEIVVDGPQYYEVDPEDRRTPSLETPAQGPTHSSSLPNRLV